jgi:hypothetical protein
MKAMINMTLNTKVSFSDCFGTAFAYTIIDELKRITT